MSLKARVKALHTGTISQVTSRIKVTKDDKTIKQISFGNNKNKVIEIVVRL